MKFDSYGQIILEETDLCNFYLQNPELIIKESLVSKEIKFHSDLDINNPPILTQCQSSNLSFIEFDKHNQEQWFMPKEYFDFDIAEWVLYQCDNEAELQRCGAELLKYAELNMLTLLQYLKYLVDTMRLNNIVWGVGRGSSVSSFVLYKIGVHRINSLYYELDYNEFLK